MFAAPVPDVNIGPDNIWALVVAGLIVLVAIGAVAAVLLLLVRGRLSVSASLPVSKETFDRLSAGTARAIERPAITPRTAARLDSLQRARPAIVQAYRLAFALVGCGGLWLAYRLYRESTPANMELLPAGIVGLLSVGALLEALIPSRVVSGKIDPIDPALLDKIQVRVERPEPSTVTLSEGDLDLARRLFDDGWDADQVARAIVKDYDAMSEAQRKALQSMVRQAVRQAAR